MVAANIEVSAALTEPLLPDELLPAAWLLGAGALAWVLLQATVAWSRLRETRRLRRFAEEAHQW